MLKNVQVGLVSDAQRWATMLTIKSQLLTIQQRRSILKTESTFAAAVIKRNTVLRPTRSPDPLTRGPDPLRPGRPTLHPLSELRLYPPAARSV